MPDPAPLTTTTTTRAAPLNQFLRAKHDAGHNIVQMCDTVMSQSHRIKGKTTDEAFQELRFLQARGASVGADAPL